MPKKEIIKKPESKPANFQIKKTKIPLALIATRDCFAFDLVVRETTVDFENNDNSELTKKRRGVIKREYLLQPKQPTRQL